MRTLQILTSDDEKFVNRIIREKKTSSYTILYTSEWDPWSHKVLDAAEEWVLQEGDETCYVISSWELPHVFSAFGIATTPAVVKVNNGTIKVFVEYPKVYDYFSPSKKKRRKGRAFHAN